MGWKKIIHSGRHCIENHWTDDGFILLKVDLSTTFNLVYRQSILNECATHFYLGPHGATASTLCYGTQWGFCHCSKVFVHQGDLLGSFLLAFVLHRSGTAIADDKEGSDFISQCWYMYIDDRFLQAIHSQFELFCARHLYMPVLQFNPIILYPQLYVTW